jgi:hypothetical protein
MEAKKVDNFRKLKINAVNHIFEYLPYTDTMKFQNICKKMKKVFKFRLRFVKFIKFSITRSTTCESATLGHIDHLINDKEIYMKFFAFSRKELDQLATSIYEYLNSKK